MEAKNFGNVLNVLVVDEMVAHYILLKTEYPQGQNNNVRFFSKFKYDYLTEFIEEHQIKLVIVFVYSRKGLHKVLPFLGFNLEIILFTNERDLWWLSESLPQINWVDIALPKAQLFKAVDKIIQELSPKND